MNDFLLVLPEQRTTTSEKLQEKWYKPTADYKIDECLGNSDKSEVVDLYNAAQGIYNNPATFKYVLKPYGDTATEILKDLKLPGEIRNTSIITPILEKKMGRYVMQNPNYQVVVNNADIVEQYNTEFAVKIKQYAMQLLITKLNEQGIDTGQSSVDTEQLKVEVQRYKETYLDKRVEQGQNILDAIWEWTDSELLYYICYYDYMVTGECYDYRNIVDGELIKSVIRPLEYYDVNNGSMFCEDRDTQLIKRKMSFSSILDRYGKRLSDKDIEYIKKLGQYGNGGGSRINVPIDLIKDRYGYIYPEFYNATSITDFDITDNNGDLFVYEVVFKTEYKKGIVTRLSEIGVQEVVVDDNYKLNPEIGDLNIQWEWINKYFTVTRIGEKHTGIMLDASYLPIQSYDIGRDTPKSCINGKVGVFPYMGNPSIVKKLIPYDILFKIYGLQIERIVSKAVNTGSIMIIPASLLGTDKLDAQKNWYSVLTDGKLIVDDSEISSVNAAGQLLRVMDFGLGKVIADMITLRRSIKEEGWDAVGWNRQIDGEILASDLKSNTERAINLAISSGILTDGIFNKFVEKSLQKDIDYSKVWLINSKVGESQGGYRSTDGEIKYLMVDGELNANTNYGIFVRNNAREQKRKDAYANLAFSAAQNGEFELAVMAIDSDNANMIRKSILEFSTKMREAKATQEQATLENNKIIADGQRTSEEAQRQLDIFMAQLDAETKINVATISANKGDTTTIDNIAHEGKMDIENRKRDLDSRRLDIETQLKNRELDIKGKDVDNKLKIAKENKNKYDKVKSKSTKQSGQKR